MRGRRGRDQFKPRGETPTALASLLGKLRVEEAALHRDGGRVKVSDVDRNELRQLH